ncbi:long-chain fatty acid--CoA ligase [Amycolatopsis ultiminotia]|uniref:Long-chain fatty acid--CoA ligase n=1 Tax=Amycolatopsis ultiminotia TaxID=543629 RepID=A0ABP6UVU7_9PSEU
MSSSERTDSVVNAAQDLWRGAETFPDSTALTDLDSAGGRSLTYRELRDETAATAGALQGLGLGHGDRVALLLHNSIAYVKSYLGAVAAGLVVVPLNVRLLAVDYRHMIEDSGATVLITTGEFLERAPELTVLPGVVVVRADGADATEPELDRLSREAEPLPAPVSREAEAPASLMYTSGTTGLPKAVVLSDRAWDVIAERAIEVLRMGDGEVILHAAPLTHGAGFLLLPTIRLGGHNLVCASFTGSRTVEVFDEFGVTGTFLVPSMIRMLLDAWPEDKPVPERLRRIYYAGSPIDRGTFHEVTEVFAGRLVQSFAQMESPMFFTVLTEDDHREAIRTPDSPLIKSAGRVLPGVELRIVDEEGRAVDGDAGEILARAPQTMNGYWNRPEATEKALGEGWLHTGDVGYFDRDGYLFVVDRTKDMIVTGGSNVYAREVEEVLLGVPAVKEAAVIGTPHRVWGEAVTAVLVPAGDDRDNEAVVAACRERLAGYRVPKRIEWVDELPRNAYGKVLKRRLRDELALAE